MKILAIRGRNLASLEGYFEIDFTAEPLLSAGIFVISGSTGAGKSTLLDAMCLALFARTPRTEQARENNIRVHDVNEESLLQSDPRFLLRRGTASGYAEADFVALNGHQFRARWSVSRAREKENGRLQQPRQTLYDLDKGEEQQGTRSELLARIVELIGLTFEQFTRSVLLAQNDFSTFLKADQSEKAALLEKLTGTELFSSVSRLIFEKNARAKEALDAIWVRIRGIELLTDEEEAELKERLEAAERECSRLEKLKGEQQALQESVRSTEQLVMRRQQQQQEVQEKQQRAQALLDIAQRDYEKGLEEQQRAEAGMQSLQVELQQARRLDVQLEAAHRSLSASEQQLKVATVRKKEAEDKYRAALHHREEGTKERERLTVWRERYREKACIAEQLAALLLHLDEADAARVALRKAHQAIASLREKVGQLQQQLVALQQQAAEKQQASQQLEAAYKKQEERVKIVDSAALDRQIEQLRQERELRLLEQARQEVSGDVKELRAKLQEGQPCPVCGSMHHPFAHRPTADEAAVSLVSRLTLQLQTLEKKKKAYLADTRELAHKQQQLIRLHRELADSETACIEIVGKQQLLAGQLAHEEILIQEQAAKQSHSLAAADALFGNGEWQAAWQRNPAAFRQTLTDFARQWNENVETLHRLERQASAQQAECESLTSFLPSLRKQYEEAAAVQTKDRSLVATLQSERKRLLGGKPTDVVEQESVRELERWKARLKQLQEIQVEQTAVVEQTRGIAEQITRDLAGASADLLRQREQLEQWNAAFQASSVDHLPLEACLSRLTKEREEWTFRFRTQVENKTKIVHWQKELETRRTESERWAKLNELAGSADGAKLRRIAQGYTLDLLLNDANVQLRALSRRYRLERVPDTLALQVIDHDMCDEVRTVHSLSGGESFLVSLALALGLSSLSSNRMKVESLFIDEGFGSLDAETLRVALDALESLRTQGRKIGVISHVQEMTERISVRIQINRIGNGRSYLKVEA